MRLLTFALTLIVLTVNVGAQEQTLIDTKGEKGGFGGPVVKFTSVNGQNAIMFGGRGGWIIDHSLVLGGGAYTVVSEVDAAADILPMEGPLDIEFGYLGFEIEYIVDPNSLLHYSIYTFIGGGATNFVKDVGPVSKSNEQVWETGFMFIMEPALNAELNVTTWFRLNAGLSYRIALGASQQGLTNRDFSGITGTLTFKFGTF